ncbi:MAG: serine/threonine-protein kinase, partial [Pirellulaceae bacterium]
SREARAGAGLDHPNVAAVYEAGEVAGVAYIASAHCPGITLAQWLRRQEHPVAFAQAAALIACLADALEHGHSRGILHRDLKPGNVMLVETGAAVNATGSNAPPHCCRLGDAWHCPKVTDFGLARRVDDGQLTREGAALGTPSYMAPEQTRSGVEKSTAATDVYGLGAILYELLVGRPPFIGETPLEILDQVRQQDVVPPRRLRPRLPRDLETICLKCLAKLPGQRYASAAALADDLRRLIAHQPIRARPVGPLGRVWRWCRRRPLVAALSAALVAALIAGIGGIAWQRRAVNAALLEKKLAQQAENVHRQHADALKAARLIAVAHREWLADHQEEARRLLDQCPRQYRSEEWRNLHALSRARRTTLKGVNPGGQQHVFFSPSGKYFGVTHFSHPGDIPIYDSDSGQLRFRLLRERRVECAAFGSDDRTLAVVTAGGSNAPSERKLAIWNLATSTKLSEEVLERGAFGRVSFLNSVMSSGSGPIAWVAPGIAAPSGKEQPFREVVIWDGSTRQVRHTISAAPRIAYNLAVTPDGGRLAIAQPPDTLLVIDPLTGMKVAAFQSQIQTVSRLAISDDGKFLACSVGGAQFPDEVRIWDLEAGKAATQINLKHRVLWIDMSSDGRFLAVACASSVVQLFDVKDSRHLASLRGHRMAAVSVAFNPTSQRLVSADGEGVVLVWDISPWTGKKLAN